MYLDVPPSVLLIAAAAVALFLVARARVSCWLLGHRVGPALVHRRQSGVQRLVVRTSRCTRCGRSYSASHADADEVAPAA